MSVITFATSKGGAGKTTSAIVLATTLARNARVCLIDADPAARLMSWAGKAPLPKSLSVVPCTSERDILPVLDKARRDYDYVVTDLEGAATRLNAFIMGESDLVVVPMGDEQPDAEGAIETLHQVRLEAKQLNREIAVRILFAKTQAAVKSRLARSLNAQVRDRIGSFTTELHTRSAFSALHNYGGTLWTLDQAEVGGVAKAINNAELFADEIREVLSWVADIQASIQAQPLKKLNLGNINHGA